MSKQNKNGSREKIRDIGILMSYKDVDKDFCHAFNELECTYK